MALITSPCDTAAQTACDPCSAVSRASQVRMAVVARAAISLIASPFGKRTAEGWVWTFDQSFSLTSSDNLRPVQSP
jgi:hypothetical protein